jgi:hypothetical protein
MDSSYYIKCYGFISVYQKFFKENNFESYQNFVHQHSQEEVEIIESLGHRGKI